MHCRVPADAYQNPRLFNRSILSAARRRASSVASIRCHGRDPLSAVNVNTLD
ncbi:MAG TPA: hypothetical protein PK336_05490 [Methanoculleus sp.]|nr:hypothetical protein [Methanoculleus sp.]